MPDIFIYLIKNVDKFKLRSLIYFFLTSIVITGSNNISVIFKELRTIPVLGIIIKKPFLNVYIIFLTVIILLQISELWFSKSTIEWNLNFLKSLEKTAKPIINTDHIEENKDWMDSLNNTRQNTVKEKDNLNKTLLDFTIVWSIFAILVLQLSLLKVRFLRWLIIIFIILIIIYSYYILRLISDFNKEIEDLRTFD